MPRTLALVQTVPDCSLRGQTIAVSRWPELSSEDLAQIVGEQEPGGTLEDARDYTWCFAVLPLSELEHSNQDGEAPEGGWAQAHQRHMRADEQAARDGSPEYAGRARWLRETWSKNTAIYPLYVVREGDGYRLWDGYRRLAGAFHLGLKRVAVLVGTRR